MKTDNTDTRRKFLKRSALGLTSLIIPWPIFSGNIINPKIVSDFNSEDSNMDTIKNIRKLGFQWDTADPFLFCVHHEDLYPKGNEKLGPATSLEGRNIGQDFDYKDGWSMYHGREVPGFPVHPHRGFETITIVRKGVVDHSDSLGATGRYGGGDVQWMTAGKGVQHAEMFPLVNHDEDNTMELFQIWLNLPKSRKFAEPSYKMFWRNTVPSVNVYDQNGKRSEIRVIAGAAFGQLPPAPPPDSWAAEAENGVAIWSVKMEAGAEVTLPALDEGLNRTVYFFAGSTLKANEKGIKTYHAFDTTPGSDIELKNGSEPGEILVLQGKPIGEPVAQYGPFVMNTQEEIEQAYADYRKTDFGGWPWDRSDPIHPADQVRFASHTDGKKEIPE